MSVMYLLMVLVSALWSDFVNMKLLSIGPLNVFPIDFLAIAATGYLIRQRNVKAIRTNLILLLPLLLFLLWLVFEILHGIPSFLYSAFGDARMVVPFFFSLVSFKMWMGPSATESIKMSFERLLLISASAVALMFVLELAVGHRVGFFFMNSEEEAFGELIDARGVRLLGTDQTFAAGLCFCFIFVSTVMRGRIGARRFWLGLFLVTAIVMSQNRTAIFSLLFGLCIYSLFIARKGNRFKAIGFLLLSAIVGVGIIAVIAPDLITSIENLVLAGLDPEQDPTGTWGWRLALAASALDQFAQHPILGQGFGGHWDLAFGQESVTAPPHDQYISLLVKCGLVGLILILWILTGAVILFFKHRAKIPSSLRPLFDTLFILVVASLPYGFAYDYVPTFGFYLGAFYGIIARSHSDIKSLHALDGPREIGLAARAGANGPQEVKSLPASVRSKRI